MTTPKQITNIGWWLCSFFIPFFSMAQPKDTLFFKNGDVLIGEVKSISLGRVKFDDDNLDVLSIKSTQIRTIKAITHIYRLKTLDGEIYYTTIDAGRDNHVRLTIDGVSKEIRLQDISNLIPLEGKTGLLWQGN